MGSFIDLTGKRFGRWTVVSKSHSIKPGDYVWNCVCNCGTVREVRSASLRAGSRSCGCLKIDTDRNRMFHDYTGERIGRIVILGQTEPLSTNGGKKYRRWNVRCDCGVERSIQTQMLRKHKKSGLGSCGCWSTERNRQKRKKHTKPYSFYLKRIKNGARGRSKSRKDNPIEVGMNYNDLISIIPENGDGFCHYCDKPLRWEKHQEPKSIPNQKFGHNFDRIDNDKGYEVDNIVLCCGDCNRTRGDRFTYEEFMLLSPVLKKIRGGL